jgi:hypothetical protein
VKISLAYTGIGAILGIVVANGDLSKKITVDMKGEILQKPVNLLEVIKIAILTVSPLADAKQGHF